MSESNLKNTKFLKRTPRLGDIVQVKSTLQEGTVRFVGGIHFKTGTWVGIELFEQGTGKNNGTIKGVTYFKCPSQTGLLVMVSGVNIIKPNQKIVTNSQKSSRTSLISKPMYKQPKKIPKPVSRPNEPVSPMSPNSSNSLKSPVSLKSPIAAPVSESVTRKIKTYPRTGSNQVIKVKPRPKSTQITKSSSTGRIDLIKKELRPPTQTNININMTMTAGPKEKSILYKNRVNPKSEIEGEPIDEDSNNIIEDSNNINEDSNNINDDSNNINDAIINGLQNTLVHLKDIVSGLAENYNKNDQSQIKTISQEGDDIENDHDQSIPEGELNKLKYSTSSLPIDNGEEGVLMSVKQITDTQRTISELSIGLVNAQQEVRKLKDIQSNLNRELNCYKEENKDLVERVAELEKENKSLETLSSKEHYIKELEEKNKELNVKYEQVKNELFFAKKNIDELYRKLEYSESPKSIPVYNKYPVKGESHIARHKMFAKKSTNYNSKSRKVKSNGSSEYSYNSSETKISDSLMDIKEQNEKLILENETLHEEMEMLKNTLLDIQEDRENSLNIFLEKMEYQENKYEDLILKYRQIESEKEELLSHLENISNQNKGNGDKNLNSSMDESVMNEMKSLITDMEVTLNKTVKSEKEARSNYEAVNKLYEASKVKMEALNRELDQKKMEYQHLSESNENLIRENEKLKNSLEELNQNQGPSASSSNEKLQEQYNKLRKQYEATKNVIEDKEAEMINYEVQCSQLEGQIIDFEKQLRLKQNEIECLIEKFQTIQIASSSREWTNEEKDEVIQDQAHKICVLEDAVKEIKDENNLLKIHNEKSINEISKLIKMKSDLELKIENKENGVKERDNVPSESNALEKEIREKDNQIEELTRRNDILSTEVKASNEKILEIQNQKDKLDRELEELNKHMSQNTEELKNLTIKYEESKKHYEEVIDGLNKDRETSVQHAKEEIETIFNQLTDTRKQFESKINQLELSKQTMQKKYESEIEGLNQQLELVANIKEQTAQAENLLGFSSLLEESERAKEVAESNAENRRKLLEKVIIERDQLTQDLASEKKKYLILKEEYDQCKKKITEIEKKNLTSFDKNRSMMNSKDCSNCGKLNQENMKLKEEIEELSVYKTIDFQEIDNALKQSTEDIEKEREEKQMLEKGYAIIWGSYLSLEKECLNLLAQLNQTLTVKNDRNTTLLSMKSSPVINRTRFIKASPFRNSYPNLIPKSKLNNKSYDSIQDYTYDFDYISVSDSTHLDLPKERSSSNNNKMLNNNYNNNNNNNISLKTSYDNQIYTPKQEVGQMFSPKQGFNEMFSPKQEVGPMFSPKQGINEMFSPKQEVGPMFSPKQGINEMFSPKQEAVQMFSPKQGINDMFNSKQEAQMFSPKQGINDMFSPKQEAQMFSPKQGINEMFSPKQEAQMFSPKQGINEKVPISTVSESSSNTLYSPKKHHSLSAFTKFFPLPRSKNRNKSSNNNNNNQSIIYESLENNDDTLYHKPEDESEMVDYSSILQKSRKPSSTLYNNSNNNNKYS